ncbi:MAG: GMP synthase [Cyanobium sp. NAT70]|nr:GMP synthase [Cyanobium sp. NAT70]|tara:strand:- start:9415 stop:10164 length:750 start_codon:yes stop_codon:yes gene_type:complete
MGKRLLAIQHVDREGPDRLADLAQARGMSIETIRPDRGDALPDPRQTSNTIALVLGGPMSVNDRHLADLAWLERELQWLATWHQRKKPVLGVCLGAQLLAVACGGSIEPLQTGNPPHPLKEVGVGAIHWTIDPSQEPMLSGLRRCQLVLHWHGDRIRLPASARLLGSSLHCPEQVFRVGCHAIGLQCHLEVSRQSLERWIQEDHHYVINALGNDGPNMLRQHWNTFESELTDQATHLLNNIFNELDQAA